MQEMAVAYSDWKWSTTFTSGRSRRTPRWNVLSIDGFTPFVGVPLAILQIETFSLARVGTHEPVPEISASSPILQERITAAAKH